MTTAISNFYTSIVSAFSSKPVVQIDSEYEEPEPLQVSITIMEAICQYDLDLIEVEKNMVKYSNGQGLNIWIWSHPEGYELKINDISYHKEVPEDLLNDLIITELQIP